MPFHCSSSDGQRRHSAAGGTWATDGGAFVRRGRRRPVRWSGRYLVEDLTRRVRLALDRIQLYREAQEANRLKDEFLSTLSHELRTPLNAVFGWADLRLRQLDGSTAHAVEVIERNAEAQIRLIEDVLDVSRIITGKMTPSMESVDVGTVLGATIDACARRWRREGAPGGRSRSRRSLCLC